MYKSKSPKRDLIVEFAKYLEFEFEKQTEQKLPTRVPSIGSISSFIKREMKRLGCDDSVTSYVHKVLGYKYKEDKYNSAKIDADKGENDSRLDSSNFEQENEILILEIENQIDFLKLYRTKLRTSSCLSQLDVKQRLQLDETILNMQATRQFASEVIDDRQTVPFLAQNMLIASVVADTNNYGAGIYVANIKKFGANKSSDSANFFANTAKKAFTFLPKRLKPKLVKHFREITDLYKSIEIDFLKEDKDTMTSKQAMKIVLGFVNNMLKIHDPRDRDSALIQGYYGIQCPECGSRRCQEREHPDTHEDLIFCYSCESWLICKSTPMCWGCHLPLYDEIMEHAKKKMKVETNDNDGSVVEGVRVIECPKCEKQIRLPPKHLEKPVVKYLRNS